MARRALLCLVLIAAIAAPAHAAPGWTPLKPIGVGLSGYEWPVDADLTGAGAPTVAWRGTSEGHQAILAVAGAAGGGFTAPVVVSDGTTDLGRPSVAAAPGGAAVATWEQKDQNGKWVVKAAIRSSAGIWSKPEPISGPANDTTDPRAAIGDNGEALVTWVGDEAGKPRVVQVAQRPAAGAWTVPHDLSTFSGSEPHIVIDHQGNATALWLQLASATDSVVRTAERPTGGTWSGAVTRSDVGAKTPHLAVGPDGGVAAIWQRSTVEALIRPHGGPWGTPEPVGTPIGSYRPERPEIALDGNGTATAVFGGSGAMAKRNTRPAGGPWGTAQLLDQGYYVEIYYPTVAANARGFALIGYLGWKDPGAMDPTQGTPVVHAAMRQPAASWTNPFGLTDAGGTAAIDVDDAGDGLVCWRSGTGVVYCRAYDTTPPRLLDLAVPGNGVADNPMRLAVRPVDSWSALGATTWSFGDGASGTGTRPTHTYAAAGRYTVRVTARDALGNATSAQRTVVVAPAPPQATLAAKFVRAAFVRSQLGRKARVRITGTITAPLRVTLRLTGPAGASGKSRTLKIGSRQIAAGPFTESFRLPRKADDKLLPGRWTARLTGPGMKAVTAQLKLPSPRAGVVRDARISTALDNKVYSVVNGPRRLVAIFDFAPAALPRQRLFARWFPPNAAASERVRLQEKVIALPRLFSTWEAPPAKGRWRCVLLAGKRVIASASVRVN